MPRKKDLIALDGMFSVMTIVGYLKKNKYDLPDDGKGLKPAKSYQLRIISMNRLNIDFQYQRRIKWKMIEKIALNFQWGKFGCITVAKRDDDTYTVIDGQHRVLAAAMIGIGSIPCTIVSAESATMEAEDFVSINTERSAVSPMDQWKARLVAKDETTVEVSKLMSIHGFMMRDLPQPRQGDGPIYLRCPNTILRLYKRNPEQLAVALEAARLIVKDGEKCTKELIHALFEVEGAARQQKMSLLEQRFRRRLKKLTALECTKAALSGSEYHGRTSGPTLADGLARFICKGMRTKRIVVNV